MNQFPKIRTLIAGILLSSLLATPGMAQPKMVESVSPKLLLQAFPEVPKTWKCEQSKASTETSVMGGPMTSAVQRYTLPEDFAAPTTAEQGAPVSAPATPILKITAVDLGVRQPDPAIRAAAEKEALEIEGLTGAVQAYSGRYLFNAMGASRLLVQVEGRGMSEDDFRRILHELDFRDLVALESKFPRQMAPSVKRVTRRDGKNASVLVYTINNSIYDELNPRINRTWKSDVVQETN